MSIEETAPPPFHAMANIFPLLEGPEFEALVADIKTYGLADKITMHEGQTLDGRNRWRALLRNGLTNAEILRAHTEPLAEGTDPLAFVISKNLKRRHLDESQRAMVAARLAMLTKGANQHRPIGLPSQEQAATILNVSERSVKRAAVVRDHGAPELVTAVDRGEVSVSAAAEVATQPVEQQREIVAHGEKEILAVAKRIKADRRQQKIEQARAANKVRTELGGTVADLHALVAAGRRFSVILADPPWEFKGLDGNRGSAELHYETLTFDEIKALPVGALAAKDCVLFLWVTAPTLLKSSLAPGVSEVLDAWGFEYKTKGFNWVKLNPSGKGFYTGKGNYTRSNSEDCLIATRGKPLLLVQDVPQVIMTPVGKHSEKPQEAHRRSSGCTWARI
jgi:N6-adenosine-specific RNA methylase IME4